jgi:hypothetical protein
VLPTSEAHKNTDAASLLNSPTLQGLKAIKKKSIAPIDEEVAERRGARVDLFIKSLHNVLGAMGGK